MPTDDAGQGSQRLQAYLAHAGVASRRASERIILEGRVKVNGSVVTELGTKVRPTDRIELDGKPLGAAERKRYILLNKPPGYLCAMSDPEGRALAVDLIRKEVSERVYNVGRLDQWSAGLVLFTNDGDLAAILVHPSGGVDKEYDIVADAPLDEGFFEGFRKGVTIDGVFYKALAVERTGPSEARVVLAEGKNREIRRLLEAFGRKALQLRRVRIGPLSIQGLQEGGFRELSPAEVEALYSYGGRARQGLPLPPDRSSGPPRH
ncbi:MAG TPA: pseudouridine synthase [Rectinemataceae bacterium]|nr:pseudouridine synthase [Rectinemataceae bacterium]